MSDTDAHFENHSVQIARMDQLFEATFSPLASSGKPLSRCGQCRRYMRLIAARPTRLYCPTCEQVYNVPQVPRPPLSPHSSLLVPSSPLWRHARVAYPVVVRSDSAVIRITMCRAPVNISTFQMCWHQLPGVVESFQPAVPVQSHHVHSFHGQELPRTADVCTTSAPACSHRRPAASAGADTHRLGRNVSTLSRQILLRRPRAGQPHRKSPCLVHCCSLRQVYALRTAPTTQSDCGRIPFCLAAAR